MLRNQQGFTLVELIVSMVIVTIVITVITSYFLAANRISILEQDQRDAQSEVRLAMDAILKEARYATQVEVVPVATAESTTQNAIYIKDGTILFKENGSMIREINGEFVTLDFSAQGDAIDVTIESTYRGQTYPLQATFQFPNLHLAKSGVIGGSDNAIRYTTVVTGTMSAPAPVPTITRNPSENPTTAPSIDFTVQFNQAVTGFEEGDLVVSGVAISSFAGSNQTYTFTMHGIPDGLNAVVIPAGACTNSEGVGNIAASHTFTKGTLGIPSIILAAYNTDWTNLDITVNATGLNCTLDESSHVFEANGNYTFVGRVGGTQVTTTTVSITNIDKVPPTISGAAQGSPTNGWYNTNVTVRFTASDALSGIAGSSTIDQVLSGEGNNLSSSHTISDLAGNTATATVSGIKIDKTPPSNPVIVSVKKNNILQDVKITNATDTWSGAISYRFNHGPWKSFTSNYQSFNHGAIITIDVQDNAGNIYTRQYSVP